ncbi:HlyD family secretion protein [Parabacteroides sp. PM5-20]|uniref:HlyD family secretion protein n=1 Tax=unclassified Parabacteroides TaxID=2649774 RepID=UPI0013D6DF70|nr:MULTISPECIES: efflux RND transporter periplasmic adaptor subunit [unclassified Parabacteroides]MDH6533434.1 HlyD family secretion protein [Parabacteroides sp. PM5-20]
MRKNKLYRILLFLPVFLFLVSCGNKKQGEDKEKDRSGKIIIETGELAAVNSQSFVLPRYGRYWYEMRIIGILEHGTIVNKGDSILQLDPTEIKKFIIDRESNLETELATLQKLRVDQNNTINEQESRVKNEVASFDLKKIELDASRFESDRFRKIKELEFEQAKITLAKEKRKLELNHIVNANDFKIQEIKVRQIENEIKDAYNILPNLTLYTPISGVFQVARNYRTNTLVKVGDNIYPGNNLANVPELKWMKVNTFINENDFLKIKRGQKVAVRLDAMPKLVFEGEIAYIGKLCHLRDQKSRQKVFDVEVNILEPDERLKPGMTVSCEFLEND